MQRLLVDMFVALASATFLSSLSATAQQMFVVKPLAERNVAELPAGALFWRIENFASLAQAQSAAGPWALVAESAGKVWLFTLGPSGGASEGGTMVAQVGPIPRFVATRYLLRINEGSGPPGSMTPAHTHPGSETFYVLAGETSVHTSDGVKRIGAGQTEVGHASGAPMQVSSSGVTDLHSLVMFVVDADKPFASPVRFP